MSLRVLLMLVWSRMLLRDVLFNWMSNLLASIPLNEVPSNPADPQSSVTRVGSSTNSSVAQASCTVFHVTPSAWKSWKPLARYSAGTIWAFVAMRKYFEMSGWLLTSRRRISESSMARPTSSYPSSSAWRRATSSEAMSWRFGEVLVWVKNASSKVACVLSQQSSLTMMYEPWRKQESDLWVDVVAYTRSFTSSGSGSRWTSSNLAFFGSILPCFFLNSSYSER